MAFRERRAVVTGAASGIGRAATERLVREGVDVLAVDVDGRRLRDVAALGCGVFEADLADEAQRAKLADKANGFDYLVNAAGVLLRQADTRSDGRGLAEDQTVNAESVFFLCQQIGARLNPGGAVVNLSSSSAKLATSVDVAPYAASKTTILSITRSFAYALAERPIRVNAICPGIVETEMQERFLDGVAKKRRDGRGRAGRRAKKGRAARARRERRGMRRAHLVPAIG